MQKYEQYVVIGHFAYKVLKESIRLYNIDYIIYASCVPECSTFVLVDILKRK